ncbi:AAA family ATPase [Pyxidicoccus sp. 3LG]
MEAASLLMPCVPALLVRRAVRRPLPPDGPESGCFPSAVLLADVSGFTPLTERLAQKGSAGAEELSRLLEQLFGPLVAVVAAHGGEILYFPGDALLALWPSREGDAALAVAVQRAVACGLSLQRTMREPLFQELSLSLRVVIAAGEVQAVVAGGVQERWQALVRGEPFTQLRDAERSATPGEVLVSTAAWRSLEATTEGDVVSGVGARVKSVRAPAPVPLSLPELPDGADAALRPFVSRVLRAALEVGDTGWLAELRRVTVLFLRLDGLPEAASDDLLPRLSGAVRALQEAVYAFGGSVNQLLVDDKGMVLVAGFGLPTCAHEDDAVRAVRTALQARTTLRTLGLRASVGIATGRVCCGLRGGASRHEYALMGRTVNLAARLMQDARDDILFDEATAQAVGERLWAERLPPVKVKGVAEPVLRFRPGSFDEARVHRAASALVGRAEERAVLDSGVEHFSLDQGGTIIVEGEAGMGKSSLLTYLAERARARGLRLLSGETDAAESSTLYYVWRPVFAALLGLPPASPPEARRLALQGRLAHVPEDATLAPLLNPVLLLDLPDTEQTAQLQDQARADAALSLMVRWLSAAGPSVLILEDCHWMDSASWELLRRLSRDVPSWLMVLSTRPLPENPSPVLDALRQRPSTRSLRLAPMKDEDILSLVCTRLGVARLEDRIAAFIQQKSEGHPFYSEELAHALRDHGMLVVERGECRLMPGAGNLEALGLPSTLEGLITTRIDRLTMVQQLTLKAASVIGRSFGSGLLRDVHPLPEERERLTAHLTSLLALDLTLPLESATEPSYLFKHVITQEVAYNLLLFSQRRQLHEAVARWYERTYAEELTLFYPLLAYHWIRAGVRPRALEALEKAGEHAMATHAPGEAVAFFSKALELDQQSPERVGRLRRARWEQKLGRALRWLGRQAESRRHLLLALELLGYRVPSSPGAMALGTLLGAMQQLLGWLPGLRHLVRMGADAEVMVEATETCADLALLAFYDMDAASLGYLLFRMANFADRSGAASLRARAYASLTVVMGSKALHGAANAYSRASLALAREANDRHAIAISQLSLSIYLLNAARFAEAEVALEEAISGCSRLGNLRQADEARFTLLALRRYQGRFAEAFEQGTALEVSARKREDPQMGRWAREDLVCVLLQTGRIAEALEFVKTHAMGVDLPDTDPFFTAILARVWLRSDDVERARSLAERHADRVLQVPLNISILDAYAAMAETFLELWLMARQRKAPEADRLEQSARRFCDALVRGTRACRLAGPAAHMSRGRLLLAEGRRRKARRSFEEAVRAAKGIGMPLEAATAHGLLAALGDPDREWHLAEASRLRSGLEHADRPQTTPPRRTAG